MSYSITSSARACSVGGIARPSSFAAGVDDELESRRLLDRQLGGFLALQDLVHVARRLPMHDRVARPERHQPAGIDELPVRAHHRAGGA